MLTVCFDAAGKEGGGPFVVVAGFGSMAKVWGDFESKWQQRLKLDGLPYFHAHAFAHSIHPFEEGWKDNEPRRMSLCQDLMQIISDHGLRKFGTVIQIEAHNTIDESLRERLFLNAYVHGARCSIATFNNYAKSIGINRNVRYVFEKGDPEDKLRRRFRADGLNEPDFTWKTAHIDRKGVIHDGFLGLQAADWLAYECLLDLKRRDDKYDRTKKPRWAYPHFDNMLGRIEVQTAEAAKGNELLLRVSEQTVYLGELKQKLPK
jgi:hypothetical protein